MKMPSFDEMVVALSSGSEESEEEGENLSTDQKIDEIFSILKKAECEQEHKGGEDVQGLMKMGGMPPGVMQDSTYNSSTSTYDGQQPTAQYNGGSL